MTARSPAAELAREKAPAAGRRGKVRCSGKAERRLGTRTYRRQRPLDGKGRHVVDINNMIGRSDPSHVTVMLDTVWLPRSTAVHELERYMRCRGYSYKRSHLVALRNMKISASDPPSTWWPDER